MIQEIRRLTIDDYDSIIKVWSDAGLPYKPKGRDSRENLTLELQRPNSAFFGLFEQERMIGVGIANFDGRKGWINRVAIDPDKRGLGLAGKLISACEEFLYRCGAKVICALIEEINSPSMACFSKAGYTCLKEVTYWSKRPSWDE
jgi:ribosomal protein S18 acetylase RimI-like enzyme